MISVQGRFEIVSQATFLISNTSFSSPEKKMQTIRNFDGCPEIALTGFLRVLTDWWFRRLTQKRKVVFRGAQFFAPFCYFMHFLSLEKNRGSNSWRIEIIERYMWLLPHHHTWEIAVLPDHSFRITYRKAHHTKHGWYGPKQHLSHFSSEKLSRYYPIDFFRGRRWAWEWALIR